MRITSGGKAKEKLVNKIFSLHIIGDPYKDNTDEMQDAANGLAKLTFKELHALDSVLTAKRNWFK